MGIYQDVALLQAQMIVVQSRLDVHDVRLADHDVQLADHNQRLLLHHQRLDAIDTLLADTIEHLFRVEVIADEALAHTLANGKPGYFIRH